MSTPISEFDAISRTVDKYGEGLSRGDIALLRSAFHPKAMLYGYIGGQLMMAEIEALFSYVAAQEAPVTTGEQHRCSITKIDVNGNVATAEVVEENCYGANYVDYFQLLKIEEQWLIVSKAFDTVSAKQPIQVEATETAAATAG